MRKKNDVGGLGPELRYQKITLICRRKMRVSIHVNDTVCLTLRACELPHKAMMSHPLLQLRHPSPVPTGLLVAFIFLLLLLSVLCSHILLLLPRSREVTAIAMVMVAIQIKEMRPVKLSVWSLPV